MTLPSLLRRPSMWIGILGTVLVAWAWVGSLGRADGVTAWMPGNALSLEIRDGNFVAGFQFIKAVARGSGISFHSLGKNNGIQVNEPTLIWPPFQVDRFPTYILIRVALWSILALHLSLWAGLALRRWKLATPPPPAPGQ